MCAELIIVRCRYLYVDLVHISALQRYRNFKMIIITYDINCQYSVHLEDRFKAAGYTWPDFEQLMLGVGAWHIWGHVLECYSSPSFCQNHEARWTT